MTELRQKALSRAAKALIEEREIAKRDYERLQRRREEIVSRTVRNEERRARFVRRIDGDIGEAHRRMVMAEANLEGMGITCEN